MVEHSNIGVGEGTWESEKEHWSRRNSGVGEMVEHSNVGVGEGTLESEKWWNIIMTVVAVKVVDYSIVIY
jgi:hypothetical protein